MKAKLLLAVASLIVVAGCEDNHVKSLEEKNFQLQQANRQLQNQIEKSRAENRQLQQQVETLTTLPPDVRAKSLYDLQTVKVTRYTNLYDKDKDGKKEKLIVYLQPIDAEGDIIKALGAVDVELWDLNKPEGQAKLGQWRVEPAELKTMWFASVLIPNYRLTFDVSDIVKSPEEALVVKVTFTDYLSGKVFKQQTVIKSR